MATKRKTVPYTVKGFLAWVAKQRGAYPYFSEENCPNARFHRAAGKLYRIEDFRVISRITANTRLLDAIEHIAAKTPLDYAALSERAKAVRAWRRKPTRRAA